MDRSTFRGTAFAGSLAIALGLACTAVHAAPFFNPTGSDANSNVAGGAEALQELHGSFNSAYGTRALRDNISGNNNTALGFQSLANNETGIFNLGVGTNTLFSNVAGNNNTANGDNALRSNVDGSGSVAIGRQALYSAVGSNNTATGFRALFSLTEGSDNVAVGAQAGTTLTSGSGNIYLGNKGAASESNVMRLGATATTKAFIKGVTNVTEPTDSLPVVIDPVSGQLGMLASSARYKTDIRDLSDQDAKLLRLRPVTFAYKGDAAAKPQYGLIAEEVADVYPELVVRNQDSRPEGVKYQELIPLLLKQNQQQQVEIEALKARLAKVESDRKLATR